MLSRSTRLSAMGGSPTPPSDAKRAGPRRHPTSRDIAMDTVEERQLWVLMLGALALLVARVGLDDGPLSRRSLDVAEHPQPRPVGRRGVPTLPSARGERARERLEPAPVLRDPVGMGRRDVGPLVGIGGQIEEDRSRVDARPDALPASL